MMSYRKFQENTGHGVQLQEFAAYLGGKGD